MNQSITPEGPARKPFASRPYQKEAIRFALARRAAMLAMWMGTGKTHCTIRVLDLRKIQRALILCPKSVLTVWPSEFLKHSTREWRVLVLDRGTGEQKARQLIEALEADDPRPLAVAVNYESARMPRPDKRKIGPDGKPIPRSAPRITVLADVLLSWAAKWRFDFLVCDESHRLKNPTGRTARFVSKLARRIALRLLLTGTPMPHSPLDLFAQARCIDEGVFGGSFTAFRARYGVMAGFMGRQVVRFQNQGELAAKMARFAFQVDGSVLSLEEPVRMQRTCEMPADAWRVYRGVEENLIAEIDAGTVTAANALVRLLRLRQITSGFVCVDEDREDGRITELGDWRAQLLADVLEDIDPMEPLVIFGIFTPEIQKIRAVCERARRVAADGKAPITGELSGRSDDRRTDLRRFQAGELRTLVVQLASGGVGIDLTRARTAIYWSVDYNLGNYEQSECRLQRSGQTRLVSFLHLIVPGTVDEDVYRAHQTRRDVIEVVFEGLRERQRQALDAVSHRRTA